MSRHKEAGEMRLSEKEIIEIIDCEAESHGARTEVYSSPNLQHAEDLESRRDFLTRAVFCYMQLCDNWNSIRNMELQSLAPTYKEHII